MRIPRFEAEKAGHLACNALWHNACSFPAYPARPELKQAEGFQDWRSMIIAISTRYDVDYFRSGKSRPKAELAIGLFYPGKQTAL
jgi:hypothetical protein